MTLVKVLVGILAGFAVGLVVANEEHASSSAWSDAQVKALGAQADACAVSNKSWQAFAVVQQQVLEHQQRQLQLVAPIVRHAYPRWPWVEDEASVGGAR
jgi:hypothetical protein